MLERENIVIVTYLTLPVVATDGPSTLCVYFTFRSRVSVATGAGVAVVSVCTLPPVETGGGLTLVYVDVTVFSCNPLITHTPTNKLDNLLLLLLLLLLLFTYSYPLISSTHCPRSPHGESTHSFMFSSQLVPVYPATQVQMYPSGAPRELEQTPCPAGHLDGGMTVPQMSFS